MCHDLQEQIDQVAAMTSGKLSFRAARRSAPPVHGHNCAGHAWEIETGDEAADEHGHLFSYMLYALHSDLLLVTHGNVLTALAREQLRTGLQGSLYLCSDGPDRLVRLLLETTRTCRGNIQLKAD